MNFKEWFLKEMTSTACVACFARPSIPMVRRVKKDEKESKKNYDKPDLVSGS